jgi:hypothetical protein
VQRHKKRLPLGSLFRHRHHPGFPGSHVLHQLQRHIDIAAGCVRIRAHDVCAVDQRLRFIGRHAWQADLEQHFDAEAGRDRADADRTFH